MTRQSPPLDERDKQLIREINRDWRQGATALGRKLRLSHTAVRYRLERLKRCGVTIGCQSNLESLGLKLFLICMEARQKSKVLHHVKNCPKVVSYFDTYGEYNFALFVVAEDTDTMESMIEQCFSFNFTDITRYTVMPVSNAAFPAQPVPFYSDEQKKRMHCDFKTACPDCTLFQKNRCRGCPLYPGYEGTL